VQLFLAGALNPDTLISGFSFMRPWHPGRLGHMQSRPFAIHLLPFTNIQGMQFFLYPCRAQFFLRPLGFLKNPRRKVDM
jgi:hypothetical protein